jgi:hypothetical protein
MELDAPYSNAAAQFKVSEHTFLCLDLRNVFFVRSSEFDVIAFIDVIHTPGHFQIGAIERIEIEIVVADDCRPDSIQEGDRRYEEAPPHKERWTLHGKPHD